MEYSSQLGEVGAVQLAAGPDGLPPAAERRSVGQTRDSGTSLGHMREGR
jgi:hypothetical protein